LYRIPRVFHDQKNPGAFQVCGHPVNNYGIFYRVPLQCFETSSWAIRKVIGLQKPEPIIPKDSPSQNKNWKKIEGPNGK